MFWNLIVFYLYYRSRKGEKKDVNNQRTGAEMIDALSLIHGVSEGEGNIRPFGEGLPNMIEPVLYSPRSPAYQPGMRANRPWVSPPRAISVFSCTFPNLLPDESREITLTSMRSTANSGGNERGTSTRDRDIGCPLSVIKRIRPRKLTRRRQGNGLS